MSSQTITEKLIELRDALALGKSDQAQAIFENVHKTYSGNYLVSYELNRDKTPPLSPKSPSNVQPSLVELIASAIRSSTPSVHGSAVRLATSLALASITGTFLETGKELRDFLLRTITQKFHADEMPEALFTGSILGYFAEALVYIPNKDMKVKTKYEIVPTVDCHRFSTLTRILYAAIHENRRVDAVNDLVVGIDTSGPSGCSRSSRRRVDSLSCNQDGHFCEALLKYWNHSELNFKGFLDCMNVRSKLPTCCLPPLGGGDVDVVILPDCKCMPCREILKCSSACGKCPPIRNHCDKYRHRALRRGLDPSNPSLRAVKTLHRLKSAGFPTQRRCPRRMSNLAQDAKPYECPTSQPATKAASYLTSFLAACSSALMSFPLIPHKTTPSPLETSQCPTPPPTAA